MLLNGMLAFPTMRSENRNRVIVRAFDLGAIACLLALSWITYGHFYRYDIEDQLRTWNDGVQTFTYKPHSSDSFDEKLYEEIRSVSDAADYIRSLRNYESEKDLLYATYDTIRARYLHFMYPHHTWVTNPLLRFLEFLAPAKQYNYMATADTKLRHAVAAPCGDVATVFVEVYRELGGQAQSVFFSGPPSHQLAEAIADGQKYLVDVDLEAIAPVSITEFAEDESLRSKYYSHRSEEELEFFATVFSQPLGFSGYSGLPSNSPRAYRLQATLERAKFIIPGGLILLCVAARTWFSRGEGIGILTGLFSSADK